MFVLRLLLGVSEAAFSPGVPFYLSFFYRREELALRAGMQVSAAPLAASFAGSLAWLITKWGQGGPLAPWRLLFLAEGFPSVLVAVVAWNVIADSPETAGFLTPRERKIAMLRLRGQSGVKDEEEAHSGGAKRKRVDWARIISTVKDPKCYLTAVSGSPRCSRTVRLTSASSCSSTAISPLQACRCSCPPLSTSKCFLIMSHRLTDGQSTEWATHP